MKTKILFFLVTLFAALSVSAQDSAVVINGVRWATRNVDAPGTFAKNSEDAGMFYKWNSKVGWPAKGVIGNITATDGSTTWNRSWTGGYTTQSATDTWTFANDPSPAGWRVPTLAEFKELLDTAKVTRIWTTQNSVNGERFTDKITGNSIFLSASRCRLYKGDTLLDLESYGTYWSSTAVDALITGLLSFGRTFAIWQGGDRANGLTVRPVAE